MFTTSVSEQVFRQWLLVLGALCSLLLHPSTASAVWPFDSAPPLLVRIDPRTAALVFTNTSNTILHGIRYAPSEDTEGAIVIDTLRPHESTVLSGRFMAASLPGSGTGFAFFTSENHAKRLKVDVDRLLSEAAASR